MTDSIADAPRAAPIACEGDDRMTLLASFGLDDLEDDAELTAIVGFAARLCHAPVALVSIVEVERQRFLAREGLDARETPRSQSFCAHAMLGREPMVVPDAALDPRFAANELVTAAPHIRFYAGAPLVARGGEPLGALCVIDTVPRPEGLTALQQEGLQVLAAAVMRRINSRRVSRGSAAQVEENARSMIEVIERSPILIWSCDNESRFDYYSARFREATGVEGPEDPDGWRDLIHADDHAVFDLWADRVGKGEPFEAEYRLRGADGGWRWMLARALPLRDSKHRVVRWYGTMTDIDAGHRRSESRDLLASELSHRIKNIFAVVTSLISLRARRHPGTEAFAAELTNTIAALGRAHDFARGGGPGYDTLRNLLHQLMQPYQSADGRRVRIEGGDCPVGARGVTPLALVFHELATNAAKYGALSGSGDGALTITIVCEDGAGEATIRWRESGGLHVAAGDRAGFGTRLMQASVERQMSGRIERRFAPGGLEVDIVLPLSAIGD